MHIEHLTLASLVTNNQYQSLSHYVHPLIAHVLCSLLPVFKLFVLQLPVWLETPVATL